MKLKDITKENCVEATLKLFERLSNTPDCKVKDMKKFLEKISNDLGYKYKSRIPFCDFYWTEGDCDGCPFVYAIYSPLVRPCRRSYYALWEEDIDTYGKHTQAKARKFYKWLVMELEYLCNELYDSEQQLKNMKMWETEFKVHGYEMLERIVIPVLPVNADPSEDQGDYTCVLLPLEWKGKRVAIIRLD